MYSTFLIPQHATDTVELGIELPTPWLIGDLLYSNMTQATWNAHMDQIPLSAQSTDAVFCTEGLVASWTCSKAKPLFCCAFILLYFESALGANKTPLIFHQTIIHDHRATITQDNLGTRRRCVPRTNTVKKKRGEYITPSLYIISPVAYHTPGNA